MPFLFDALEKFNTFIWGSFAFFLIVGLGGYLSVRSGFFQIRYFGPILCSFFKFLKPSLKKGRGIHPLKSFFAAIGGCIGIGNIVGICTAVQMGGPGAVFWVWVGGLMGMAIQYSEAYLGMKYRIKNESGNYDGGPMYFLPKAYGVRWIAPLVCILLCVYGVEIFMFNVMADSIVVNWNFNPYIVVPVLLAATMLVALGGIQRVGEVSGVIIPLFITFYMGMSLWVLFNHLQDFKPLFQEIFKGAFSMQAAKGGFLGSTVMQTVSLGLSRAAYSGDVGIGYTSIIYAESRTDELEKTAGLTILGNFLDTFVICTMSLFLVLSTGHWQQDIHVSTMVQAALGLYFPYMDIFMPFFLFLLGYTTILAYFVVGVKCAKFISPKWGPRFYYLYATIALPLFAFVETSKAFVIMSIAGGFLLILNITGIFLLRREVSFRFPNVVKKS